MKTRDLTILFLVGQIGTGGLEKQLYLITKKLKTEQFDVYIIVWSKGGDTFYKGKLIELLGNKLIFSKSDLFSKKLFSAIKFTHKIKPYRIISFSNFTNIPVSIIGTLLGVKSYGAMRSSFQFVKSNYNFYLKLNLLVPRRIISNSKEAIKDLKIFRRNFGTIYYLSNIVEEIDKPDTDIIKIYDSISVGTFKKEKRLDRLVIFLSQIKDRYPNYRHIHLGEGDSLDSFKKDITVLGLNRHIELPGKVSNVSHYLRKSRIFLHFAEYEGMPNAIMEAMTKSLPIITTQCGDVDELVFDDINGYIVKPYDSSIFTEKTSCLLSSDERISLFGMKSFKIIEKFDSKSIILNLKKILD